MDWDREQMNGLMCVCVIFYDLQRRLRFVLVRCVLKNFHAFELEHCYLIKKILRLYYD